MKSFDQIKVGDHILIDCSIRNVQDDRLKNLRMICTSSKYSKLRFDGEYSTTLKIHRRYYDNAKENFNIRFEKSSNSFHILMKIHKLINYIIHEMPNKFKLLNKKIKENDSQDSTF
jgi:hypothetical protein